MTSFKRRSIGKRRSFRLKQKQFSFFTDFYFFYFFIISVLVSLYGTHCDIFKKREEAALKRQFIYLKISFFKVLFWIIGGFSDTAVRRKVCSSVVWRTPGVCNSNTDDHWRRRVPQGRGGQGWRHCNPYPFLQIMLSEFIIQSTY